MSPLKSKTLPLLGAIGVAFAPLAATSQVVINEVMASTTGTDTEFIELYNTTGAPIDITNWSIQVYDSNGPSGTGNYGNQTFSVFIPPATIPANGYYLLGSPEFQSEFSVTPDLAIADDSLANNSSTFILKDGSSTTIYSAFVTDDDIADDSANDAGVGITPDITVGPDGTFYPAGFSLTPDGGGSAFILEFSPKPAPSATPQGSMDNDPPVAITLIPADESFLPTPPTPPLVIGFNEDIAIGTGFITLYDGSDDSVIEAFDVTSDIIFDPFSDPTAIGFTPASTLTPGDYYVLIDATAVDDLSGNSFAGFSDPGDWNFTIAPTAILDSSGPYTENFSGFNSATSFPDGWTVTGDDLSYDGDWGTGFSGGFRGNASVLGFQHTGGTGVLVKTLTVLNDTGSTIEDLTISYRGRVERPTEGRSPEYSVEVAGTPVPGLSYSTSSSTDNVLTSASVSGLFIPDGDTFTITWTSERGGPGGSSKQIGISEVSVDDGLTLLPPTVDTVTINPASITTTGADFASETLAEGGDVVTDMGFVYSETSVNANPEIGDTGVTQLMDLSPGVAPFFNSATGLTPDTAYTVRSYATNSVGTSYSAAVDFSTLPAPPSFTGTYMEAFDAFDGTFPAGWTGLSSGGSDSFGGDWGSGSSAGFRGNVSEPGVAGYQHTSGSGTLELTLSLTNDTGSTITELNFSYLGRVERETEGRSPEWTVTLDGVEVPALFYSTSGGVDTTVAATVGSLSIPDGAAFTVVWSSDRGLPTGAAKQIGLGELIISTDPIIGDPYDTWALNNGLTGANNGQGDDAENSGAGDTVLNIFEFILGGDPLAVDPSVLPDVSFDESDFIFTFNREDESEPGTTLTFQWTTDLDFAGNSNDVPILAADSGPDGNGVLVTIAENGAAADTITVRVPLSNAVNGKIQGRLQATRP
ncbi:MAG: lamin tail domain-containing protein [Verrucomicrobiota bacterium]